MLDDQEKREFKAEVIALAEDAARRAAKDSAGAVAEDAAERAVTRVLERLGLDNDNPRESYEDLIFLRRWRETTFRVRAKVLVVVFGTLISGTAALAWMGVKGMLTGGGPSDG